MKLKEKSLKKTSLRKIKTGKVKKNVKEPSTSLKSSSDEKNPLDFLRDLLDCDHVISLTYGDHLSKSEAKEKWRFLVEHTFNNGLKVVFQTWSKETARLGLKICDEAIKNDVLVGNVVIGPEADDLVAVKTFHNLWGKQNCKLRRFQDGKIKESIEVANEHGPGYFPLAKLKFLLETHFVGCIFEIYKFDDLTIQEIVRADSLKKLLRQTADKLTNYLQELSTNGSLPLRQVRAYCGCLHNGDVKHAHFAENLKKIKKPGKKPKIVEVHDGHHMLLKLKAHKSPPVTKPINILLEITLKDKISPKLFARIRMTYAIAMKKLLENLGIKCMIKQGSSVLLVYNGVFFCLRIQNPNSLVSNEFHNPWKLGAVSEFIQRIGSPNTSWTGLCQLVRRWARIGGFETETSSVVLDLFMAWLYFDGGNLKPSLDRTSSVERAFLMFLHKLSFTDFRKNALFLTLPDEFDQQEFVRQFTDRRTLFPALTIITPLDITPSSYTASLPQMVLTRMVNCSRKLLFDFTSDFPSLTFAKLLQEKSFRGFDAIVRLKPLMVPKFKRLPIPEIIPQKIETFPIIDFDPVQSFLTEAQDCFGSCAKFFFNRSSFSIGIKLVQKSETPSEEPSKVPTKPDVDLKLLLEDLKVLGKGLILSVEEDAVD